MLEIFWKQILSKNGRVPDDEGCSGIVPGNNVVYGTVVDEVVGLDEKRRWRGSLRVGGGGIGVVFGRGGHGNKKLYYGVIVLEGSGGSRKGMKRKKEDILMEWKRRRK